MSILLSDKHGVNPSILRCPLCFTETGIAMLGRLPNDKEAPRYSVDRNPCQECQEQMEMGILLIERGGDWITGNRWVITPEASQRLFAEQIGNHRMAYIHPEAAQAIGLYDGGSHGN